MKISHVTTRVLSTPADNPLVVGLPAPTDTREFVLLELGTDQGLVGIGLTFFGGALTPALRAAVDGLARLAIGEDPDREGLLRTPQRVETSLRWLTRGYGMTVEDAVGNAVFEESHQSMILVRDIELYSLCEHHLLPFFGRAHVAYIPDGRIVGLSKLPRHMPRLAFCASISAL